VLPCSKSRAQQRSATDAETARTLMDEADRLRDAGDLWAALERYHAADEIMHVPSTGIELAKAQAALLQLVEARATALSTVHLPEQPNESKVFRESRAEAVKLAAALAPRIADLTLAIEPASAQAAVRVDGQAIPRISRSLPYKLNPGSHVLLVEAPGFASKTEQLTLAEGQHATLGMTLTPAPSAATTEPVAKQPSQHAAQANEATRPHADPGAGNRARAFVAFAAGGALLVTGAVAGILSLTKASDVRAQCNNNVCPESLRGQAASADTLGTIANVTLPLGVLGVGYGIVELLLQPSAEHAQAAHASGLHAMVTGTGVVLHGQF
jgi:hypothetical protein